MSLPEDITSDQYFETCVKLFMKYHYLVSVPNTHILVENILDNIDVTGLKEVDLYKEDLQLSDLRNKSKYIDEFLTEVEKIPVGDEREDEKGDVKEIEGNFEAPIGAKKKYEVLRLAAEVKDLCEQYGCDTVVDFGSGLGYLDERLHDISDLNVLGLECDAAHVARARLRQRAICAPSKARVLYENHRVDGQSERDIEGFLKEHFPSHGPVCITGLHACGDLTVDGINLFLKMADVKLMVLMPCCYHRMQQENNRFKNFPISSPLKRLFDSHDAWQTLHVPFLRLAAHPPRVEGLKEMVFSLLARGVMQLYAWRYNCTLKRNKRKAVKKCNTFDSYIQQAVTGFRLVPDPARGLEPSEEAKVSFDLDQLRSTWSSLPPPAFPRASLYILLQSSLQPRAERLVLADRARSLRGAGVRRGHKRLFSDAVSPRCAALIAVKDTCLV